MFLIGFVLCAVLVTCEATPSVNLSQAVKNTFLKGHNDARDKLGIPPLVWDEKLSSFAAKAGSACQFQHSGGPYGENLYASYPDTNKYEEVARKAVSNWVNEKKYVDPKWNCVTRTTNTCGHYSQEMSTLKPNDHQKGPFLSPETSEAEDDCEEIYNELIVEDPDAIDLDFNHCRIGKIQNLETTTQVETLCLRQNLIKDIEGLSTLVHLREVDLYDNQITQIANLECLVNLEHLDLSYNRLRKIEGLGTLVNLRKLFLVNNKISKIENLNHLVNLELLELGDNRIRVIEGLSNLVNLHSLFLGKNKISKLQGLSTLTHLSCLSVQSNRLLKIEGLENLTELDELYLSHNGIEKIEGLDSCTKLTTLDLAGNRIKKIENLSQLEELAEFWFNDNAVESWDEIEALTKLKKLETVYLERNPIYYDSEKNMDPSYRRKIMLTLPWVRQIDATLAR